MGTAAQGHIKIYEVFNQAYSVRERDQILIHDKCDKMQDKFTRFEERDHCGKKGPKR